MESRQYLHTNRLMTILVLNGPNLDRLGKREPETYGSATLEDVQRALETGFPDVDFEFVQSNHEGELIESLHRAADEGWLGVVFNPGGYTHTSVALRDAVSATEIPVIEVHITNIHNREDFRHTSMIAPVAAGQICGLGLLGYSLAVRALLDGANQQSDR